MQLNGILSSLGSLSGSLAGLIVPGAAALPQLIAAGKNMMESFQNLKAANGGTAPEGAEEQHRALVAKVNEHADRTFGRAEGGGE